MQILGQVALYVPGSHKQFIKCMYYLVTVLFLICKASFSFSVALLFCCKSFGFALGSKLTVFPFLLYRVPQDCFNLICFQIRT